MDRLKTMSVFVAVADEAGFSAASRRLNMSPPSVTRAVSDLEAQLGARLLHRTTRSVTLTEAGERYLVDCRRILADVDEANRHAAGVHAEPRGQVSITGSVVFGRRVLTPILLDLQERYPEISISALFLDRVTHLVDEGIDIAIRIAELPDSSLAATRVGAVRHVLCASPDYLDTHGRPRKPQDLSAHKVIEFSHETRRGEWILHDQKGARHVKVKADLKFNIADAAISAAISGRGITRVLSYMIVPEVSAGELEIVLEDFEPPPVPVHVVHKETGQATARVRATVDYLADRLRGHPLLD